ncbi:MAG TPA: carbon-nitrogen hydrolase family protein [Planctomycetota bacterium]|nr:carbon-nitrogen hydrolase family protein [Planctomycetota bacterium]
MAGRSKTPRSIRVALAQMPVNWKEPEANVQRAEALIAQAAGMGADLAALPECFVAPARERSEAIPGPLSRRFSALARKLRIHLVMGSIGERCGEQLFNTACLIDDRGWLIGRYRKRFLWFTERALGTAGTSAPVFRTRLGRIGLAVCWDLAFPEHFRELALAGADLTVCPAYWQAGDRFGRLSPGQARKVVLLPGAEEFFVNSCVAARAAENGMAMAFVNAVGRTRVQGRSDRLIGLSQVVVPFRGTVASAGDAPALVVADVDMGLVREAERVYALREDARMIRTRR